MNEQIGKVNLENFIINMIFYSHDQVHLINISILYLCIYLFLDSSFWKNRK